jgi:ubiquinone/menaquinone biosynthesis C-methylase UbiE
MIEGHFDKEPEKEWFRLDSDPHGKVQFHIHQHYLKKYISDGDRVLEIGPGPGRLILRAARRVLPGGEAVGVDIQAPMIAKLKARANAAGVDNLSGIVGDAAEVSPPGTYDVVYMALTMGEIPRQREFLRMVFSALKPGGRLSITEMFPDPHFLSQKAVRLVTEEAGFQHLETLGSRCFYTSNFLRPAGNRTRPRTESPEKGQTADTGAT